MRFNIEENRVTEKKSFFLLLRVFGLLFSSLLLFPQRFDRYVLRQVFVELGILHRTLLNPRGLPVLIPLAITGYKC